MPLGLLTRSYLSTGAGQQIVQENLLAGDTGWQNLRQNVANIAGFADATSYQSGATVSVYASSVIAACTYKVWRLGYYGGNYARLRASGSFTASNSFASVGLDQSYSLGGTSGVQINATWAPWSVAFTFTIGTDWLSGYYLILIDNGTNSYWIPFLVYDPTSRATILVRSSDTTWQAYNTWNNYSIYTTPGAYEVSFDRPYQYNSNTWYQFDLPMVHWLEQHGYDVTYCACVDVDNDKTILRKHPVVFSIGHDEYWSQNMRDGYNAAVASGTSLGYWGANGGYSRIRFQTSRIGTGSKRDFVCYKNAPTADPQYPSTTADNFRSVSPAQPENTLLGVQYRSFGNNYPWVVANGSHWSMQGTGFKTGDSLPQLCGYEYDTISYDSTWGTPPAGLETIAASPVTDNYGNSWTANSTFYRHSSGAGVFAAGTIQWSWGLNNSENSPLDYTDARFQRLTQNVLDRLICMGRASL